MNLHVHDLHIPNFVRFVNEIVFYRVVHLLIFQWNLILVSSRSRMYVSYCESISSSESWCSLFWRRYCTEYRGSAFKRRSSNSDDRWPMHDNYILCLHYVHASFAFIFGRWRCPCTILYYFGKRRFHVNLSRYI